MRERNLVITKKGLMRIMIIASAVLVTALGICGTARAELIVNGDFEATPFDSNWTYGTTNIAAVVHQGLASNGLDVAGTQAAYLPQGSGLDALYQEVESGTQWQFDMLFAAESPGSGTRSLNMTLEDSGSGLINLRLDPNGKLYAYNSSSPKGWHQVSDSLVSFSVDGNGDNSFDDAEDTLNVHSLRIVGNYSVEAPYYDVYMSAANSSELEQIASGLTYFHIAAPAMGMGLDKVRFATGASTGDCVVDAVSLVSVPEPSVVTLLLVCVMALGCYFRRNLQRTGNR